MDKRKETNNDEKVIIQEDCSEDNLKNGILTLTNKKIMFEKTKAKIATLSKEILNEELRIDFNHISNIKSEGRIIKKLVIEIENNKIYKFGVLNPNKWAKAIKDCL